MSFGADQAMSAERPSYTWENKQLLLKAIMRKLNLTDEDLEKEPSFIRAKIREANIDELLETSN